MNDIEKKIILLAGICQRLNSKIVIESAHKDLIDEDTLSVNTTYDTYVKDILELMKKYGIEVIGRTKVLTSKYSYNKFTNEYIKHLIKNYYEKLEFAKKYDDVFALKYPKLSDYLNNYMYSKVNIWKEDEIRIYLMKHPQIKHYCILDDDDMGPLRSDLNKVRDHLVVTSNYNYDNYYDEGLQPYHEEEINKILKKENKVRNYVLKMQKKQ